MNFRHQRVNVAHDVIESRVTVLEELLSFRLNLISYFLRIRSTSISEVWPTF
jgi:hypothetical protein